MEPETKIIDRTQELTALRAPAIMHEGYELVGKLYADGCTDAGAELRAVLQALYTKVADHG